MAAVLTNANNQTTPATQAGAGDTQLICSGKFTNGARCIIELTADSLDYATVYEFTKPGSVVLSAATGTTIRASVVGGDTTNTSIDLSAL